MGKSEHIARKTNSLGPPMTTKSRCPNCGEKNVYDGELMVCNRKDLVYNASWAWEIENRITEEIAHEKACDD